MGGKKKKGGADRRTNAASNQNALQLFSTKSQLWWLSQMKRPTSWKRGQFWNWVLTGIRHQVSHKYVILRTVCLNIALSEAAVRMTSNLPLGCFPCSSSSLRCSCQRCNWGKVVKDKLMSPLSMLHAGICEKSIACFLCSSFFSLHFSICPVCFYLHCVRL